jgi:hypothetical protein
MLLDVQIPIFEQPLLRCPSRQALAVVCFDLKLTPAV